MEELKLSDSSVLEALTHGAMLPKSEGSNLADDLEKIHALLDSASKSDLAQGDMNDGNQVERFMHSVGFADVGNAVSLRNDTERETDGVTDSIVELSKRSDGKFNYVPRVV